MPLYGIGAELCERQCLEHAIRARMSRGQEADAAVPRSGPLEAAPQVLRAETADAATATVETAVTSHVIARALAAAGRFFRGNGSER